jgi:hypothetical protein
MTSSTPTAPRSAARSPAWRTAVIISNPVAGRPTAPAGRGGHGGGPALPWCLRDGASHGGTGRGHHACPGSDRCGVDLVVAHGGDGPFTRSCRRWSAARSPRAVAGRTAMCWRGAGAAANARGRGGCARRGSHRQDLRGTRPRSLLRADGGHWPRRRRHSRREPRDEAADREGSLPGRRPAGGCGLAASALHRRGQRVRVSGDLRGGGQCRGVCRRIASPHAHGRRGARSLPFDVDNRCASRATWRPPGAGPPGPTGRDLPDGAAGAGARRARRWVQVDGELLGPLPVDISCVLAALSVVVPR